jgi:hypothetical protein
MSVDKYIVGHREGTKAWVLKVWVPETSLMRRIFRTNGAYKVLKTFGTEARALAHMRKIAEPRYDRKYYNEHGYEEAGSGW